MGLSFDDRGSLSLMMAVCLPVLVLLSMVCLDLVRIRYARNVVNESVCSGVDSVLADYDRGFYEGYGLFALRGKEYGLDFRSMVRNNLKGKDLEFLDFGFRLISPLNDSRILKKQILEEMKIRGLVELGQEGYGIFKAMEGVEDLGADYGDLGGSASEAAGNIERKVASNMETIRGLEERRNGGESGLDGRIDELYRENKSLMVLAEDLVNGEETSESTPDGDVWNKLKGLFGDETSSLREEAGSPGLMFYKANDVGGGIIRRLSAGAEALRDDLLLSEYVLSRFSTLESGGEGEAERIIGNGSGIRTLFNLLLFRVFVDGTGYFVLDPKAPPELVERLIYSVVMGLGTGAYDTLSLVGEKGGRVPVVNVPGVANPLDFLKLSYRDHLLGFSLLAGEECLLKGVLKEVQEDYPGSLYCGARGSVKSSISLVGLKFLPEGMRFLGGEIRGGCFVFEEEVSLSF